MSLLKRAVSRLPWIALSLVFTVFAIPVWGQSSAIVGEVETDLNANAEFVLRFVTNRVSMSTIEYGLDGELTFKTDELIALSGMHRARFRECPAWGCVQLSYSRV